MKTKLNNNLLNIRKFFHLICYEQSATKEEVYNFLQEMLQYVFKKNKINLKDFNINIHFVKEEDKAEKTKKQESKLSKDGRLFSENTKALMMHDSKDPNLYDIFLPAQFASLKPRLQSKPQSNKNPIETDELLVKTKFRIKQVKHFLEFIYDVFHEIAHIIQYIQQPEQMQKYDEEIENMNEQRELIEICLASGKEKRKLLKTFKNFVDTQGYIAPYEIDANDKADEYFCSLLQTLIKHETDAELLDFLCYTCQILDEIRNSNLFNQEIQEQFSEEAKIKLEKLKLTEHLFLNASDYLYFIKD